MIFYVRQIRSTLEDRVESPFDTMIVLARKLLQRSCHFTVEHMTHHDAID